MVANINNTDTFFALCTLADAGLAGGSAFSMVYEGYPGAQRAQHQNPKLAVAEKWQQ
jgi:hypothetical protein